MKNELPLVMKQNKCNHLHLHVEATFNKKEKITEVYKKYRKMGGNIGKIREFCQSKSGTSRWTSVGA